MQTNMDEANNNQFDKLTYKVLTKLAYWIPKTITPNQITIVGTVCGLSASLTLIVVPKPNNYIITLFLLFLWWMLDFLDGIHARRTYQTSLFGDFLDSSLDRVVETFFFCSFLVAFHATSPIFFLLLLLRNTLNRMGSLLKTMTDKWHMPTIIAYFEQVFYVGTLIVCYFWQPSLLLNLTIKNEYMKSIATSILGNPGNIIQILLLTYAILIPYSYFILIYRAKQCLTIKN